MDDLRRVRIQVVADPIAVERATGRPVNHATPVLQAQR